jgi:hypothetical protein
MKTNNYCVPKVPTANIAVNKSRIKLYTKNVDMPTYYLEKGQEFQIELFNPTTDVVLAKIILNGKALSQGGLVLNPGQRVFLDRYFDVAKKFLFDTYEVSKSSEVMEAIKNNGDIKIEFYKESKPVEFNMPIIISNYDWTYRPSTYYTNTGGWANTSSGNINLTHGTSDLYKSGTLSTQGMVNTDSVSYSSTVNYSDNMKSMDIKLSRNILGDVEGMNDVKRSPIRSRKLSKTIETGRVEQGSVSEQKFKTVNKNFDYIPFHTLEYKLMPLSQKINTVADISVKRYCTNCGHKLGKTDKFCSSCGKKA